MEDKSRMTLLISSCVIGILLIVFGIQVYMDTRPELIDANEIIITEANGNKENEKILTVNVDSDRVVFYSFDGGKNYQTENTYSVSENRQIEIILKDNERRKVGSKKYNVKVYEDQGPTITLNNFPNEIYVGDTINLSQYAKALDSNKINCDVVANPLKIDTSIPGTYKIEYTATDSNNLSSSITVELKVISKNSIIDNNYNPIPTTKTTYYRYRTKTKSSYDCNYYSCDYLDENDSTDPVYVFDNDSYCCTTGDCNKVNPKIDSNSLCIYNYTSGGGCIPRGEQYVDRFGVSGNICYDKNLLIIRNQVDPIPDNNVCSDVKCKKINGETICTVECLNNLVGSYNSASLVGSSLKTECDENEVKVNGYCHLIDSYASLSCPDGYAKGTDRCYKVVLKTCSKTCETETWSNWSNWSTTRVIENEYTQVQTKTE